jgi:hypothetical protein
LAVPGQPQNIDAVASLDGNTITWDSVDGALWYNLYWKVSGIPTEDFSGDLSNWATYKKIGTEDFEIESGELHTHIPNGDSAVFGWYYAYDIAPGDITITIDKPDHYNNRIANGLRMEFRISNYGINDVSNGSYYCFIQTWIQSDKHVRARMYNIDSGGLVDSVTIHIATTPLETPTKLRFVKDETWLQTWYYTDDWYAVSSFDYGANIDKLVTAAVVLNDNTTWGGWANWDNLTFSGGQQTDDDYKIVGVTSPYQHFPPTIISRFVHNYCVTAVNSDGEGQCSTIVNLRPWQHYYLGPDRDNAIELFPDWDYKDGEIEKRIKLRTASGKLYDRKLYDYKQLDFSTMYVPASTASIVNSWWNTQTKLQWFIELGSSSTVDSVMLLNNTTPFASLSDSYDDHYKGKIILGEYT